MKGDFTRDTFDPERQFTRVLMQQGRVQLDADWNEQASIFTRAVRSLAADLIGPHGGPEENLGFRIARSEKDLEEEGEGERRSERRAARSPLLETMRQGDLLIGAGRYYVDGILVENPAPVLYSAQPSRHLSDSELLSTDSAKSYLIYLDVWERHVSYVEEPEIVEVALLGPDTATRAQLVWQIKALEVPPIEGASRSEGAATPAGEDAPPRASNTRAARTRDGSTRAARAAEENTPPPDGARAEFAAEKLQAEAMLRSAFQRVEPRMKARAINSAMSDDPCLTRPDARYRGLENQLYRVEIHVGGGSTARSTPPRERRADASEAPARGRHGHHSTSRSRSSKDSLGVTFKWSRENGSVVFPIRDVKIGESSTEVSVMHLGRDARFGLRAGDWVELVDDKAVWRGLSDQLLRVEAIDAPNLRVTLSGAPSGAISPKAHALLRRWDQREAKKSVAHVSESGVDLLEEKWIPIEDGVEIWFEAGGQYRTGDYWLVPARTATGDVEWPGKAEAPLLRPPHGIEHHLAPIALVQFKDGTLIDMRRRYAYLAR